MSEINQKLCGVIRVDPETERYIIAKAKAEMRSKVSVIRQWVAEEKAKEGKRLVAVQGADGILRADPNFK